VKRAIVTLAGILFLALATPAAAALDSDNLSLRGKVPDSAGAIGARFSPDGHLMYVTAATGLQIYDVSAPESPRKLSQLALPHLENEDVDVGRGTLIISNDPSFTGVGVIYLIDVADPSRPSIRKALPTNVPLVGQDNSDNGHIANCIHGCDYLYTTGTSEGLTVYDIRDLDNPRKAGVVPLPGNRFTHDVEVDAPGSRGSRARTARSATTRPIRWHQRCSTARTRASSTPVAACRATMARARSTSSTTT
jgi:hypothetical protein